MDDDDEKDDKKSVIIFSLKRGPRVIFDNYNL